MKGRYSGRQMNVYGHILPGAITVSRYGHKVEPLRDKKVREKLKVINWYYSNDENLSKTSRHFGFTRKTIRKWLSRYKDKGYRGLLAKSRKPHAFRKSKVKFKITKAVIEIRNKYPGWSKYKIQVLLKRKGLLTSASTIGRILKKKGLINLKTSKKKSKAAKNPKKRYPKCIPIKSPGDLIQMDTKQITATGGVTHYQFTATDVYSRLRILQVYPSCSSRCGKKFLKICRDKFPFKLKAIQTDNGKEFMGDFYKEISKNDIPHFFIHPRSPKENSYVERSHESDEYEFYRFGNRYIDRHLQAEKLSEWEKIYNEVRPHKALDYMTPLEFFNSWKSGQLSNERKFIINLQH